MFDLKNPTVTRNHYTDVTDYTKTKPINRDNINIEIPPSILLEANKMKQQPDNIVTQIENIYGDIFIQKNKSIYIEKILKTHINRYI